MSGNMWEWTRSLKGEKSKYPYQENDRQEKLRAPDQPRVRGGAFYHDRRHARCASRYRLDPVGRNDSFGFRVVVSPTYREKGCRFNSEHRSVPVTSWAK